MAEYAQSDSIQESADNDDDLLRLSQRPTIDHFIKGSKNGYAQLPSVGHHKLDSDSNHIIIREKLLANLERRENGPYFPTENSAIASLIITSVSNFSVQYNFQAISVALLMMSQSECTSNDDNCRKGIQANWVTATSSAAVFVGAIFGQLTMGFAGDLFGRNKTMIFTLSLASFSALLSAIVPTGSATSIYAILICFRFLLGVGLGGVYPLSATKAAEQGSNVDRSVDLWSASWAFFWQCPGAMTPWLIAYLMTFGSNSTNFKWRMILAVGFLPFIIVSICSMYENKENIIVRQSNDKNQNIWLLIKERDIQKKLFVTAGGWFLYDVCFYGVNLFGGEIISSIISNDDDNISSTASIRSITSQQLIATATSIPACIITIYLVKPFGTKLLQVYGFGLIAFFFLALSGLCLLKGTPQALVFLVYCGLLFSLSAGPNVTTFILPAEQFPRQVRSSFNGISAAFGKLGAVVGAYLYGPLANASNYVIVMLVCANLSLIASILTFVALDEQYDYASYREYDRQLINTLRSETNNVVISDNDSVTNFENGSYKNPLNFGTNTESYNNPINQI